MTASAISRPEAAVSRDLSEARIAAGLERHQNSQLGSLRFCFAILRAAAVAYLKLRPPPLGYDGAG